MKRAWAACLVVSLCRRIRVGTFVSIILAKLSSDKLFDSLLNPLSVDCSADSPSEFSLSVT